MEKFVIVLDFFGKRVYFENAFTEKILNNLERTMKEQVISHRKKQKAETYTLILDSAKSLFENYGFEKATMKKIATKAGISPGSIFKHFENKSALLAAALFNDIEIVQEKAIDQIPHGETVQKQFLSIAEQFYKYYAIRPALSKVLVEHSLFVEGEWAERFNTQTMRLVDKTAQLIQKAKKQKKIKENIDSKQLASAFFSHYLFILILCVKEPKIDPVFALKLLAPLINLTISGSIQKDKETTA
ncbi:MAG: TetR/AcrR family transcriptional regulator [Desulfobacteraceae bacterium]|nr:TetR/AcrR family transcriptional regulator [Desulfobacteraceae bacterium]